MIDYKAAGLRFSPSLLRLPDRGRYRDRDRNTVERAINKMKDWRGIATRYDKTPESYLAGLHLRAAIIWIRSLQTAR
ncbi:hypothetical protein STSP_16630 [Streptomyces jeddahensis]|uniref:Uncharacterized protein n=1 Tax=Streptomyces jeddahensis TaxID=1716141 RepID=A0A177HXJ4_9ACTN|nr:hypothetical protein STSP_16630 [Streptomyces jeddahensis]